MIKKTFREATDVCFSYTRAQQISKPGQQYFRCETIVSLVNLFQRNSYGQPDKIVMKRNLTSKMFTIFRCTIEKKVKHQLEHLSCISAMSCFNTLSTSSKVLYLSTVDKHTLLFNIFFLCTQGKTERTYILVLRLHQRRNCTTLQ